MKVYAGSDHAGFEMKQMLCEHMQQAGHEVVDLGAPNGVDKTDYPDIAVAVGEKVVADPGSYGVLVCGTGIGVAIAANKVSGVRAAHVHDTTEARFARLHNNANIVTVGQRILGMEVAKDIVDTFLSTAFEGGRHEARVAKINAMDDAR